MKFHLRVFVEIENLGKAMNALTDSGITGFYILEYKGMSPEDWEGFSIKEDPKSAITMIKDYATDAVQICTVLNEEQIPLVEESVNKALKDERYTIIEVPIRKIIVNYGGQEKRSKEVDVWFLEKKVPCFYCGEDIAQRIRIDINKAKIWCTNCGATRHYIFKGSENPEGDQK